MTLKEYRQIKHPTIEDLEQVEADFICPEDVAFFVKCAPFNMNLRAQADIERYGEIRKATFGFPAQFQGTRLKIPRVPFIRYIREEVRGESAAHTEPKVETLDDILGAIQTLYDQVSVIRERLARPFPN